MKINPLLEPLWKHHQTYFKSVSARSVMYIALCVVPCLYSLHLKAETFLYDESHPIIGSVKLKNIDKNDTFLALAAQYSLGYSELVEANATVDPWFPYYSTSSIILPGQFILPERYARSSKRSILINLAEMRLYYFHLLPTGGSKGVVFTYPISIGQDKWRTPIGRSTVVDKIVDPSWYPPPKIIEESKQYGEILPVVVPPGEGNPLGKFAIQLNKDGYFIHGTNRSYSIGLKATHGCIRLRNEDIEELFKLVERGTDVDIEYIPIKTAKMNNILYLESHVKFNPQEDMHKEINHALKSLLTMSEHPEIDDRIKWEEALSAMENSLGYPVALTFSDKGPLLVADLRSGVTARVTSATVAVEKSAGEITSETVISAVAIPSVPAADQSSTPPEIRKDGASERILEEGGTTEQASAEGLPSETSSLF